MASPAIYLSLPSASLFHLPPSNDPRTLPVPQAGFSTSSPPFSISPSVYSAALDVRVPITIACTYAITAIAINKYNKANGNKPWNISKTRAFFYFVVAHNIFLAVYSAWTFIGMSSGMYRTFAGWNGPHGLIGAVDSLCKMHGNQGLGNAITYNPEQSQWISQSPETVLLSDAGTPFSSDTGRLWNEGLAFYGWIFYLSKFYEVFDTFIILAKGKRSSTLQTYHHAGAMMCMWAGMRYMSPPIWMFVFVNSAIHTMMYTYYTLTAFSVPVPQAIKRTLTTLQIAQFLFGASYAALHSFITYTIPVLVYSNSPSTPSPISSALPSPSGLVPLLKSFLFGAYSSSEGIAETVAVASSHAKEAAWTTQYVPVNCIDTSGETFAIWLNVLYLAPLTALFIRFFVKSYLRRSGGTKSMGKTATKVAAVVESAAADALKGVERMHGNSKVVAQPKGKSY